MVNGHTTEKTLTCGRSCNYRIYGNDSPLVGESIIAKSIYVILKIAHTISKLHVASGRHPLSQLLLILVYNAVMHQHAIAYTCMEFTIFYVVQESARHFKIEKVVIGFDSNQDVFVSLLMEVGRACGIVLLYNVSLNWQLHKYF